MKKISKILIVALSVMLLAGLFVFAASADTTYPEATAEAVIQVIKSDGTILTNSDTAKFDAEKQCFYDLNVAFTNAPDGSTIKLLDDYEFGKLKSGRAFIASYTSKAITLDLNGKTLSVSYNKYGSSTCYQLITVGSGATLNLIGNGGTIKASAAIIIITGGDGVVNFTENDTINFVGIGGYKVTAEGTVAASSFQGAPMIKIGSNASRNATLKNGELVHATVNAKNTTINTNFSLFGVYPGAELNVENSTINSTFTSSYYVFTYGWYNNISSYFKALGECRKIDKDGKETNAGTYVDEANGLLGFYQPTINLEGSTFNNNGTYGSIMTTPSSYGIGNLDNKTALTSEGKKWTYISGTDTYYTTKVGGGFSHAPILNVTGCTFNHSSSNPTFTFDSAYFDATIKDSEFNVKAARVFECNKTENSVAMPLAVLRLTDVDVNLISSGVQSLFYGPVTAIVDGGFYNLATDDYFVTSGWTWTTNYEGMTGLPSYVETLKAFGVLVKQGTMFSIELTPKAYGVSSTDKNTSFAVEQGYGIYKKLMPGTNYSMLYIVDDPSAIVMSKLAYTFEATKAGSSYVGTTNTISGVGSGFGFIKTDGSGADLKARPGKYVIKENPVNDNLYVNASHYYDSANHNNSTPFIHISSFHSTTPLEHVTGTGYSYPVDSYAFYALDFDIMSLTGLYAEGSFQFVFNAQNYNEITNDDGSVTYNKVSTGTQLAVISLSTNGSLASTEALETTPGVWNHVSLVMELPKNADGSIDTTKITSAKIHVYVNGVFKASSVTSGLGKINSNSGNYYNNDPKYGALTEIRINTNANTSTSEDYSTSFDNIVLTMYDKSYAGTAQDIANRVYSVYGKPQNIPAASVIHADDTEDFYYDVLEAIEAVKAGETVKLHRSVSDDKFYMATVPHTLDLNGYELENISSKTLKVVDNGDGTYSFAVQEVVDLITVSYTYYDGRVETDTFPVGNTIKFRESEPSTYHDGWYKRNYEWQNDEGAKLPTGTVVAVSGKNYSFSSVPSYAAYPTIAMMDAVLISHYHIRLGVPTVKPTEISNVKILATDGTERPFNANVKYANTSYDMYSIGYPGVTGIAGVNKVTLQYDLTIDGQVYSLSQSFSLSLISYLNAIYDSEQHADCHTLVADLVQYTVELYKQIGSTCPTALSTLHTKTAASCTKLSEIVFDDSKADYSALSTFLSSVCFAANSYEPSYVIEFKKLTDEEGNIVSGVTAVRFECPTVTDPSMINSYYVRSGDSYSPKFAGTDFYSKASSTSIPTALLNQPITIKLSVKYADGTTDTLKGVYDLSAYCQGVITQDPEKADFARAIYAFSKSAKAYRYYVAE